VKEGITADRSMKIEVCTYTLTEKQVAASERKGTRRNSLTKLSPRREICRNQDKGLFLEEVLKKIMARASFEFLCNEFVAQPA
jgi:hypothetical protein